MEPVPLASFSGGQLMFTVVGCKMSDEDCGRTITDDGPGILFKSGANELRLSEEA